MLVSSRTLPAAFIYNFRSPLRFPFLFRLRYRWASFQQCVQAPCHAVRRQCALTGECSQLPFRAFAGGAILTPQGGLRVGSQLQSTSVVKSVATAPNKAQSPAIDEQ